MTGLADLVIEIAFDDGPLVASPSWTAVTSYVHEGSCRSGRDNELEHFPAGTATLVLNNDDARFDPLNTAGTYYGKLLPWRQVRIRDSTFATTIWRGHIAWDGWSIDYIPPSRSEVTVQCTDLLSWLADADLATVGVSWYPTLRSTRPRIIYRCNEASGTTIADSSGNAYNGTLTGSTGYQVDDALVGDTDPAISLGGASTADARWSVPSAAFTPTTGSWTIAGWVKPQKGTAETVVFYGEDGSGKKIRCSVGQAWVGAALGNMRLEIDAQTFTSTADDELGVDYTSLVVINTWNWCVWRYDATTGKAHMYVESAAVSAGAWYRDTMTAYAGGNMTNEAWVGADNGAANACYGDLDEVCFWHEALSDDIVELLGAAGRGATTVDDVPVLYAGDLPGERIGRIAAMVGIPAALLNLDDGHAVLAGTTFGGNALELMRKAASADGGELYVVAGVLTYDTWHTPLSVTAQSTVQAVISDDGAGIDYRAEGFTVRPASPVVNVARFDADDFDVQEYADSASITANGIRPHELTGLPLRDAPVARSKAEWVVRQWKDPIAHPRSFVLRAIRGVGEQVAVVVSGVLRYRVTVEFNPPGTTTPSQYAENLIIERVEHQFSARQRDWTASFVGSPAGRYAFAGDWADVMILDTGELDTAVLAH